MSVPKTTEDFLAPLPEDRQECLNLIKEGHLQAIRWSALYFWHIGRIISELAERGEENILDDVSKLTGYQKRSLQYMVRHFNAFPDIKNLESACQQARLEWTDFKLIGALGKEKNRQEVIQEVVSGKIERCDIKDEVKRLKDKERREDDAEDAEEIIDSGDTTDENKELDDWFKQSKKELGRMAKWMPEAHNKMKMTHLADLPACLAFFLEASKVSGREVHEEVSNMGAVDYLKNLSKFYKLNADASKDAGMIVDSFLENHGMEDWVQ